jgi:hypothetical protein
MIRRLAASRFVRVRSARLVGAAAVIPGARSLGCSQRFFLGIADRVRSHLKVFILVRV